MFKIKFRNFIKRLICTHRDYDVNIVNNGFQSFKVCRCKKCEKVWVNK